MKILKLFLLLVISIGAYCSSQNHTTSNILNQLIAAIDELLLKTFILILEIKI